jgi:hypothetical protein
VDRAGSRSFAENTRPSALRELLSDYDFARPEGAPPFVGGLVGYLAHGAVR